MKFVAAKCPQCGGDLQMNPEEETGFCMHCGSKIIVQDAIRAVRIDNTHMVDTWMQMGQSANKAGNFKEAYDYFTKVLEVDQGNWNAWFFKGVAAGYLSTIAHPRLDELVLAIQEANKIIEKLQLNKEELQSAKNRFVVALYDVTLGFNNLIEKRSIAKMTKFSSDWNLMFETRNWHERAINYFQIAINLIKEFTDETSKTNIINLKKRIIEQCA